MVGRVRQWCDVPKKCKKFQVTGCLFGSGAVGAHKVGWANKKKCLILNLVKAIQTLERTSTLCRQ